MLRLPPALSRGASPQLLIAFQSRRPSNPGSALPSPVYAPQSNAVAARIGPSPLHAAALLHRCVALPCCAVALPCSAPLRLRCSRHLMAELLNAIACRCLAPPSRGRSLRCSSFADRRSALLCRHPSPHCLAPPSRGRPLRCSSFAVPGPSRAPPSPGCAALCFSFASPSKSERFPCRRFAIALPLQRTSPQLHRRSAPCCASPLLSPPSQSPSAAAQSRSAPVLRHPLLRHAVALHRNAPLSHRYSGSEPSVHSKRPLPLLRHWPMPRNWP